LISLNYRCLEPGKYASHIERWLQFYKSQQLLIIDGEKLKSDPIYVMNKLQHFLNVQPIVDYEKLLKYDSTKGFYCPITCKYFEFDLRSVNFKISFWCHRFDQNINENLLRISALASKRTF
jgi:hypothetical protein